MHQPTFRNAAFRLPVQIHFWWNQASSRLILGSLDGRKTTWNIVSADQTQATYRSGLKFDSNQILQMCLSLEASVAHIRFQSAFCIKEQHRQIQSHGSASAEKQLSRIHDSRAETNRLLCILTARWLSVSSPALISLFGKLRQGM